MPVGKKKWKPKRQTCIYIALNANERTGKVLKKGQQILE